MANNTKPLEASLRWEIYIEYRKWCKAHGTICTPNSFRIKVLPGLGYKMANGTFQREWERLMYRDKLIAREPVTGAPIIADLSFIDARLAREVEKLLTEPK